MSLCDCDLEPVECYSETKVAKARKNHRCDDCFGAINKGDGYTRVGYVFDGQGRTVKRCGDCQAIRCMIGDIENGCSCLPTHGLCHDLQDEAWNRSDDKFAEVFGAYNAAAKARGGKVIVIPRKETP